MVTKNIDELKKRIYERKISETPKFPNTAFVNPDPLSTNLPSIDEQKQTEALELLLGKRMPDILNAQQKSLNKEKEETPNPYLEIFGIGRYAIANLFDEVTDEDNENFSTETKKALIDALTFKRKGDFIKLLERWLPPEKLKERGLKINENNPLRYFLLHPSSFYGIVGMAFNMIANPLTWITGSTGVVL